MSEVTNRRLETLVMHNHDVQNKYVYYILAVVAACIGFCVNYTKDLTLTAHDWLLGFAIFTWGLSFYYGICQVQNHEIGIQLNIKQLNTYIKTGSDSPDLQDKQFKIQQQGAKYRKIQNLLLLLGVIAFIAWRIYKQEIAKG